MPKASSYPLGTPGASDTIMYTDVVNTATENVTIANLAASAAFADQFAPLTATIDGARDGDGILYIAHRGGSLIHPEHTMTAYRSIVAQGAKVIEQDCYLLADGSLGVMHDATVDRTTTATGNTADQTAASWQKLVVDVGASLGGAYTSLTYTPPLFDEVVREFGNKVVLAVEAKNAGSGVAIVATLLRHGVRPDAAMVASFSLTELAAATAAGYTTQFIGTGQTPAALSAAGVDQIAVPYGTSEATIDTYLAQSIEVGIYTINRQFERDIALGYGCTFFYSDDPIYLSGTGYKRTTDPFASQTWYHGHLESGQNNVRGAFVSPDRFSTTYAGAGYQGTLQGWASPIIAPTSLVIEYSVKYGTADSSSRWHGVFLGTTDQEFVDGVSGPTGYHFLGRAASYPQAYSFNGSGGSSLGSGSTVTAIPSSGTSSWRITVTPTTVRMERTDVASDTTAIANNTYRPTSGKGWFLVFGHDGIGPAEFYDVTITAS